MAGIQADEDKPVNVRTANGEAKAFWATLGSVTVGKKVNIRASGSLPGGKKKDLKFLVRPSGKAREAVVAVVNEGGAAEILLEYRWLEEEK